MRPPFTNFYYRMSSSFLLALFFVSGTTVPPVVPFGRMAQEFWRREMAQTSNEVHSSDTMKMIEFRVYNREQELRRRELEKKEKQWEEELLKSMKMCDLEETGGKQSNPTQSLSSHSLNKTKFRYKNLKKSSSYSYCICEEKPYVEEKIDKQNSYECICGSEEYNDVDVVAENKTAEIFN